MKIGIIGTGYVGLVTGTCFAESGNTVFCMDNHQETIDKLKRGVGTIFEPLLEDLLKKNTKENRLIFTTNLKDVTNNADIIFLCLPTPPNEDGTADVSRILDVSGKIAEILEESKIIVAKSTMPVGTSEKIKSIFNTVCKHKIQYVFNPEFLKEGNAVTDFMSPDRVVLGSSSARAIDVMKDLYSAFMRTSSRIIIMDEKSAEITKYAANGMLATRISFMNDIALLCEKTGANIDNVRVGISTDGRIGDKFLFAGSGYGGSCFPKDVRALIRTAEEYGLNLGILKAVEEINSRQKTILYHKIKRFFGEKLKNRKFAVWGLSFKPKTDDIRESPSIVLIEKLLDDGATINATDPAAIEKTKAYFRKFRHRISFYENYYDTLKGADALILITEWNDFRKPDFERMMELMKTPVIFDGRNIYNPKLLKEKKFVYFGIGK
ncbi:UDP-glucose/GDP-mannose dehydrogenase family protein [bacterium]|nr:MAG: UDP-glucose/GDP-mannose dehydrogenase family protein [bacterium]